MARRGEVPFVAIRVGRSNDPRETLAIARELKCSRATALGYVALWEELILEVGDAVTGRLPKGYAAQHIAAKLDFPGPPRRIVDVLKGAGLLGTHKTILLHPYWRSSTTGEYARDRAEQREYWRKRKAADRAAKERGDVSEMSNGHPVDVLETSHGTADIKKERNGMTAGQPPQPPAEGGGRLGASRWQTLSQIHPSPGNRRACTRYLELMSEDDWALCQWVLTPSEAGGAPNSLKKKRALRLDAHKFLATEAFGRFLPEWTAKRRAGDRPANGAGRPAVAPPVDLEAERAARASAALKFVLEQLEDDDLSEAEKASARARFAKAHPDIPPPWGVA